jgi:type III secretion system low calcium response chaperone LcrH/SycD
VDKLFQSVLETIGAPTSSIQLTSEEQQMLYSSAHSFYQKGDYSGASDLFTRLALCDPFAQLYWRGLASSKQMEEKYEEALSAWSLVCLLCEQDPLPHFHAAECLLTRGEREEAVKALNCARSRASEIALLSKIDLLLEVYGQN